MVYNLYDLTPEEIAIVEGKGVMQYLYPVRKKAPPSLSNGVYLDESGDLGFDFFTNLKLLLTLIKTLQLWRGKGKRFLVY
jgi:hypothetical protein